MVATARRLRSSLSLPEGLLWQRLRKRARGAKFRRQHPLGPYVIDFYCPAARLPIEVDGQAHDCAGRPERDEKRDAFLRDRGLTVVRVLAADVLANPDAVADALIRAALPLHHAPHGPPPHASHGEELSGTL